MSFDDFRSSPEVNGGLWPIWSVRWHDRIVDTRL